MTTEKLRPGMLVLYVFGPITLGPHTLTRHIPALEKKFPAKYKGEYWEYVTPSGEIGSCFFSLNCIRVIESEEDLVI